MLHDPVSAWLRWIGLDGCALRRRVEQDRGHEPAVAVTDLVPHSGRKRYSGRPALVHLRLVDRVGHGSIRRWTYTVSVPVAMSR